MSDHDEALKLARSLPAINVNAWVDPNALLLASALLSLHAECERMRAFIADIAEDDCAYMDDCPSRARHGRCQRCRAGDVLSAATKEPR